jgi:hypothetical protein
VKAPYTQDGDGKGPWLDAAVLNQILVARLGSWNAGPERAITRDESRRTGFRACCLTSRSKKVMTV